MPSGQDQGAGADTRRRLLDAAGEVFARHGFARATVRDICRAARANVAAVNYHFGGKRALYAEVLSYAHRCSLDKYPPTLGLAPDADAPARVQAFVRSFLLRVFDESKPAWHACLIAREMAEPSPALASLVDSNIRPNFERLSAAVAQLLGARATPDRVRFGAASIVSQCLFYHYARPLIAHLWPRQRFTPADVEAIAGHVTAFSLGALQSLGADAMRVRNGRAKLTPTSKTRPARGRPPIARAKSVASGRAPR